ncbi:MAG: hypothetical protein IKZ87_05935 [Actinomycetaceae bacterium]|nr:hypothetical protein [Actinomycetaceae bacterium]
MKTIEAQVRSELFKIATSYESIEDEIAFAKAAATRCVKRMSESCKNDDWAAFASQELEELKTRIRKYDPNMPGDVTRDIFSCGGAAVFNATVAELLA